MFHQGQTISCQDTETSSNCERVFRKCCDKLRLVMKLWFLFSCSVLVLFAMHDAGRSLSSNIVKNTIFEKSIGNYYICQTLKLRKTRISHEVEHTHLQLNCTSQMNQSAVVHFNLIALILRIW